MDAKNVEKSMTLVPLEHELAVYDTMAKQAVSSKFYRSIGDASAVMTIMLSARELGISPMSAINGGLNIIQGKVEISARLMNAMIRRAGHSIQTIECSEVSCKIRGKRRDSGDVEEASFTLDEAKRAGLVKSGGGWTKYPSDMLYARTLSRLARRLFPDVIGCAYVEGEIGDSRGFKTTDEVVVEIKEDSEDDKKAFAEIVKEFHEDDKSLIEEYLHLVHETFEISYEKILEKYTTDKAAFLEKFSKWKMQAVKSD